MNIKLLSMNLLMVFATVGLFFSCEDSPKTEKETSTLKAIETSKEQPVDIDSTLSEIVEKDTISSNLEKIVPTPEKSKQPSIIIAKKDENIAVELSNALSHKSWNALLKKYVDNDGNVNYHGFKGDEAKLQTYLDFLAKNKPTTDWSKNEKLAYYINLYNAATVKLILDNYPTKSIKDIRSPWGKKWVKIGDKLHSLGGIEHKILRKMNEPRIHFAINCASYSCPKLINAAFTANEMEAQLAQATKDFINDTTRNKFNDNSAKLSEIFKWYKGDFTENGTVLEYIKKHTDKSINTKSKISYLNYDWSLNEAK
ncbi:DUF547 domain-containing protein [uncultured Croceitalea sp.]|uniref:DUF547 domain-containing protein n=1 Tax=uncultured Croceitalea sp. TaxID=1798908 RepID=UPI00330581BF